MKPKANKKTVINSCILKTCVAGPSQLLAQGGSKQGAGRVLKNIFFVTLHTELTRTYDGLMFGKTLFSGEFSGFWGIV